MSNKKETALAEQNNNEQWDKVITAKKRLLDLHLRDVWDYRYLIKMFIKRDFVVAYKQTILGPIWYLVQPLITAIMYMFVFGQMANVGTDGIPHILFYFAGTMLWTYFTSCLTSCAATFTSNCPKFLTYMPVTSKKDEIEFWDNPESIESLVNRSIGPDAATFNSFPIFNIMVKTKLTELPTPITSTNTTDLLLRKQFFSNGETEMTIDFDGIPFHIVFNKGFLDYLKGDYTLGDDIWLYLNGLYTANGVMTLNVRDYTTTSPEAYYDYKVDLIKKYRAENSQ